MRAGTAAGKRSGDRGSWAGAFTVSLCPARRRFRQRQRLHERTGGFLVPQPRTGSEACPAYRKNNQAWVEQKNGAIVRRLVGYGRFTGAESVAALADLYRVTRLHGNLFQPSFKLLEKTRVGARVVKRYHPPMPPAARILAYPLVAEADNEKAEAMLAAVAFGCIVC